MRKLAWNKLLQDLAGKARGCAIVRHKATGRVRVVNLTLAFALRTKGWEILAFSGDCKLVRKIAKSYM